MHSRESVALPNLADIDYAVDAPMIDVAGRPLIDDEMAQPSRRSYTSLAL